MGQNKIPSPWQNYWGWTMEQYKPRICSTPLSERDCGISVYRACGNAFVERSTKQHAESSIKPGQMKGCIDPTEISLGTQVICIFSKSLTYLQQLGRLTLQKLKLFKMSLHARKAAGPPHKGSLSMEQKGTVICIYTPLGLLKGSQQGAIPKVYLKATFLGKGGKPQFISAAAPR